MTYDFMAPYAVVALFALQLAFVVRAILRPHREASSRAAWVLVILAMPAIGLIAYVLFGETNIGQKRLARYRAVSERIRQQVPPMLKDGQFELLAEPYRHLFRLGQSVDSLGPLGGNSAELMPDDDSAFDRVVADIDAAQRTVHLLFYIWLDDTNGLRVAEAAKRAARRGVEVRVMADDIGSRAFIRSRHWTEMKEAGVQVAAALPVTRLLLHPIRGRIDLRNHRKIAVIDTTVAYCGSQNCADAAFRIKARYAPWIDLMLRLEGPVAAQLEYLFIQDWMAHVDERLSPLIADIPGPQDRGSVIAQVIGTGPTVRSSAMPEVFEVLIHAARERLLVTTPYYVPSEGMHDALCLAARRGVDTTLILPRKNDSFIVAAASRSYYPELIEAGVRIFEYPKGLLHAKILTLDGSVALIGSANLDRRSFELNYESNILLHDDDLTAKLVERQEGYLADAIPIGQQVIDGWSRRQRLWNNTVAMMGPVL